MQAIAGKRNPGRLSARSAAIARGARPAQWLKNGVLFAGVIFGGRLLDPTALRDATFAVVLFCLLCSGFYLLNDVRDIEADRRHPVKRLRPVAAGELPTDVAIRVGAILIVVSLVASLLLGVAMTLAMAAYALLMSAYNLGLKQVVILDVFAIATGFVIRAAAGAIAVDVSISPWLLICTFLLALVIGFGKRRSELVALEDAARHRRNLEAYSTAMLDQFLAVAVAGTLAAYAVYTFDAESAPRDHRMMLTIPIVAYGMFRYLHLLHQGSSGGAPETMLLTDRRLLASICVWAVLCALLFYLP